jgi:hypothetical protein
MDKVEAKSVLAAEMAKYRARTYRDLAAMVGGDFVSEASGQSGVKYQIEINVMWDFSKEKVDVRVLGGIDDGRFWTACCPLSDSFIVAPDGSFIGE